MDDCEHGDVRTYKNEHGSIVDVCHECLQVVGYSAHVEMWAQMGGSYDIASVGNGVARPRDMKIRIHTKIDDSISTIDADVTEIRYESPKS